LNYTRGSPCAAHKLGKAAFPLDLWRPTNSIALHSNKCHQTASKKHIALHSIFLDIDFSVKCKIAHRNKESNYCNCAGCTFYIRVYVHLLVYALKANSREFDTSDRPLRGFQLSSMQTNWVCHLAVTARAYVQQLNWCGKDDYCTENTSAQYTDSEKNVCWVYNSDALSVSRARAYFSIYHAAFQRTFEGARRLQQNQGISFSWNRY
jgi:hypothetical protein